jgi:hypothetical protein
MVFYSRTQKRLSDIGTITSCQSRGRVRSSQKITVSEEPDQKSVSHRDSAKHLTCSLLPILESPNKKRVPKRVHLRPPSIQNLCEVLVYLRRAQAVSILRGKFIDYKLVENVLDVLEVRHVTTCANDGMVANCVQTLDVLESCEGTIRSWLLYIRIYS